MSNKIVSMRVRYAVRASLVRRVLCSLLIVGLGSTRAIAQSSGPEAVLLLSPAHVENPALRAEIARGLRSAGLLALQVRDLGLDPVLAACRQPSCAAEAARAAGKAALLVSVSESPRAQTALLELYWHDPSVGDFRERSSVARDSVGRGVAALAQRVLQRRVLGERALLRVDTTPAGAEVFVDGQLAGLTPYEQASDAGTHEVRVALAGFDGQSARVQLRAGDVQSLRLALDRRVVDSLRTLRSAAPPVRAASAGNFVLGGVLAVAAVPLLIGGINPVLNRGQCIASTPSGCERAQAGAREAGLIGAGVVALGGAAVLFLAQPLRVQLEAAPRALGVRASGRF